MIGSYLLRQPSLQPDHAATFFCTHLAEEFLITSKATKLEITGAAFGAVELPKPIRHADLASIKDSRLHA